MNSRGSQESRTRHSPVWGPVGFMTSMAIPAAIAIIGIVLLGWGEISWLGAIVWGVVATIVFTGGRGWSVAAPAVRYFAEGALRLFITRRCA